MSSLFISMVLTHTLTDTKVKVHIIPRGKLQLKHQIMGMKF